MKNHFLLSWIIQVITAIVLGFAVYPKFAGAEESIALFTHIEMEPFGRYLIGALELIAIILLLIPSSVAYGALLTWGVMVGATMGHMTTIGYSGSNLSLGLLALALLILSSVILYIRRLELPLIGSMFDRASEAKCATPES
jgi:hypothetical protein|tara:strand:- start:462 stop:884 length:423 start_codon:yes stop_codon:yes gene_type:complete